MALNGNLFTSYLKEVYLPQAVKIVFQDDVWFNQPFIEVVPAAQCPAGPHINVILDYAVSTNAEVYVQGAPAPSAYTMSDARAYFTKDFFQETAKVHGDTLAMLANGGNNTTEEAMQKSIMQGVMNLKALMTSSFLTDLAAQVDSTTAYSDASLSRSTYACASYEAGSISALTRADLMDAIEGLMAGTYGPIPQLNDLLWLMPPNQHTNLANLQMGAQYAEFSTDASNMSAVDTGAKFRTDTFESIPILQIPTMTTTEIYLVKRSATKIYMHNDITAVQKDSAEWAENWLITGGANLVVSDPRCCGKLTGITA